jgi:hypothetical protein
MEAPDGGSHEMRCFVAEKLMTAAQAENVLSKGSRKSRAKLWLPSADSSPRRPLETTSLARRMAAEQVKKQQPHRF